MDVIIKELPEQIGLEIRLTYPFARIGEAFDHGIGALMGFLGSHGMSPADCAGPIYAVYHNVDDPEAWDMSIGIPLRTSVEASGEIHVTTIPGGKCAVLTHVGSYDQLKDAWEHMVKWLESSGNTPSAHPRESYRIGMETETDPEKLETDIIWPLAN